jgi:hypothetical protein
MTMSDERLDLAIDRAIDEVARQMTEGEPPGGFRVRVIARLGDRPRQTWTIWTLAPVAAAALVIVAIFVTRGYERRVAGPATLRESAPPVAIATPPAESLPRLGLSAPGTEVGPKAPALGRARQRGQVYAATTEIEALAPPRLEVAPLGVEALPTESIAVTQLDAIAPIAVEPLPANDQRP